MDRESPLTRAEVALLWSLENELEGMRREIANARVIATFPCANDSRHPVLAFAFNRVPAAIIERTLLRLAEAIDPLLHRASLQFLKRPVVVRAGRDWVATDSSFQLLLELRHYRVAHFVRLKSQAEAAYEKLKGSFGNPYAFLDHVVDKLEDLIAELDEAGLYEPREGLASLVRLPERFSQEQLSALVEAANSALDLQRESPSF